MVKISDYGKVSSTHVNDEIKGLNNQNISQQDVSIFDFQQAAQYENIEVLQAKLDSIEEKQGFFSNIWNGVKETTNIGVSVEKCDEVIAKYKNGEITFEEAMEKIEKFDTKQSNSLELFSNIATGVAAIGAVTGAVALTASSGGLALPVLIAIGAGAGALTKTGYKFTDRATNKKEKDALNGKQIAKDFCSGAVTGAVSAMTMGTAGSTFQAGASVGTNVASAASRCANVGVKAGAVSGSANYMIDCAFDENKDFNAKDLVTNTAVSAAVGGAVGGIMGTSNTILRHNGLLHSGGQASVVNGQAQFVTGRDLAANSICTAEYKGANRMLRDIVNVA